MSASSSLPVDVVSYIAEHCNLPTLMRLASGSRLADRIVARELKVQQSHILAPFVKDEESFRCKLTELDSVVSGSAALAICSPREAFTPADLDIYTPANTAETWVRFLTEHEGYHVQKRSTDGKVDGEYHGGIGLIITLERGTTRIDVVESLTICATMPICNFWSTVVMTLVTGTGIVALFPRLLEEDRGVTKPDRLINIPSIPDFCVTIDPVLLAKYEARGFDVRDDHLDWARETDPDVSCGGCESPACRYTVRWVGDWHTLQRAFGTVDQRKDGSVLTGTMAKTTTLWCLGAGSCGAPCALDGFLLPQVWVQDMELVG